MAPSVKKSKIINDLIAQFNLSSYFEYNKFDGELAFDDVNCLEKSMAFIPEHTFLNKSSVQRISEVAERFMVEGIVPFSELLSHCAGKKFDIIFFDPVHIRPQVDLALKQLLRLLNPGGFLVIHDCSPKNEAITRVPRKGGDEWVGETFKAFALFRHFNPFKTLTVDEDYGVAIIVNDGLNVDYSCSYDIDYSEISQNRREYLGLITYTDFLDRLKTGSRDSLFVALPVSSEFKFNVIDGSKTHTVTELSSTASQVFWCFATSGFSEDKSIILPIRLDGSLQSLNFHFAGLKDKVTALRFDFSNCETSAELDSVRLLDLNGQQRWKWEGDPNLFTQRSGMHVVDTAEGSSQKILIATGSDPNAVLHIPVELLACITDGWALQVVLRPQPRIVHALLKRTFI
ncbi:hypothetical protein [Pseudomonas sp. TWI929]|uniref:hypothetical protein n=1 Tax=Pseudomonas sp. TWI929 TaxID=3136795 RepID=UPI00320A03E7